MLLISSNNPAGGSNTAVVDSAAVRLIADGWTLLAEAESALAHTCIIMLHIKSAKLTFIFEQMKSITQSLQQRFEEVYIHVNSLPIAEVKASIHDLRMRLKDYLLEVKSEVVQSEHGNGDKGKAKTNKTSFRGSPMRTNISSLKSRSYDDHSQNNSPSRRKEALDYIDVVERMTFLTGSEKELLINTVFGDEFGGSWQIYKPF